MRTNRFSWQYTQFVSDNIFINIIIHETDMFGLNQIQYSSITYCTINGEHAHSNNDNLIGSVFTKLSNNKLSVDYNDGTISIFGVIDYDNNLSFQNILSKDKNGHISCWDVTIPHGKFLGEIKYESRMISTEAFVYQDKQYGDLPIQNFLNRWGWSVTVNNHVTNGLFSILSKDNEAITIEFSCDGKKISKETTASFDRTWVNDLEMLLDAPYNTYRMKNIDVDNKPIRKRIKEIHNGFEMTYCRYVCKKDSVICGVCEYMRIY